MRDYKLSAEAMVMISGSSAGAQPKYYDKGYWYKTNHKGYEGLAEYYASIVLSCSNIKNYVAYEECMVNGKKGCRSKSFLTENESFISFQRLYDMYNGGELAERIMVMENAADRISFVVDFIKEYADFDCTDYLSNILSLDWLALNTDRHFHNLGIVVNRETGQCYAAPIFDNGDALLSDYDRFPVDVDLETNINAVHGQPFSASLEMQAVAAGIGLKIDYDKLYGLLEKETPSRALSVLRYQLDKHHSIFMANHCDNN